ncbi:hypothetical protein [Cohaesibacter sp. ES.047]|uniref:hypothetical protein n=1 Tax=Cohaesibacter sp. ES.047 TaxID=1798205 RepID=UPI000BB9A077|nr:hypothetical protein [Cohaesibacter sp. ES.047]
MPVSNDDIWCISLISYEHRAQENPTVKTVRVQQVLLPDRMIHGVTACYCEQEIRELPPETHLS